jgi:hypothetical protein
MMGALAALWMTVFTGLSVYRSCTAYAHIKRDALTIDAVGAATMFALFYFAGAWS